MSNKSCSNILKLGILVLIAALACSELQIVNDMCQHGTKTQPKLNNHTIRSSTPFELGMGPEYSCDIAGDGPRRRTFDGDDYDP